MAVNTLYKKGLKSRFFGHINRPGLEKFATSLANLTYVSNGSADCLQFMDEDSLAAPQKQTAFLDPSVFPLRGCVIGSSHHSPHRVC